MCGRYVSVQGDADLLAEFDAVYAGHDEDAAEPNYNVAPTDGVRAVVNRKMRGEDGQVSGELTRQLRVMKWGLVPSWSKDRSGAARMINARAESVPSKPAFKRAFASRRCLIPADGWFEWQRTESGKQAFYMTPADGSGLAFAGLYEFWSPASDDPDAPKTPTLTTATIITTASVGALADIHDRMPLVLDRKDWNRWLDPTVNDPGDLLEAWDEAAGEHIELRPVSSKVNSVRNNDASLIERVQPLVSPQPAPQLF